MRVVFPTPGAPVTNTILGFSRFWFRRNPPHFELKAKVVYFRGFWAARFRFQQPVFLEELVSFVLKPSEVWPVEEFDERVSPCLRTSCTILSAALARSTCLA